MRRPIDNIEIKEPPIKELKKKKSCLKRTCLSGCGCIIIFIIAFLLLLKFAATPREKELKQVPENFPTSIPVYDKDNIVKITFVSGRDRAKWVETATFVPKIILSPILLTLDKYDVVPIQEDNPNRADGISWDNFIRLVQEPVGNYRDTIKIEWQDLSATPKFIQDYYQTELKKGEFEVNITTENDDMRQFIFMLENIDGVLYIKDNHEEVGTDYLSITINIPNES